MKLVILQYLIFYNRRDRMRNIDYRRKYYYVICDGKLIISVRMGKKLGQIDSEFSAEKVKLNV